MHEILTLPGPAVTLSLAVESHHGLQLENVTVGLGKLPVLLVRQELVPAQGLCGTFFISQLFSMPEASLTVMEVV